MHFWVIMKLCLHFLFYQLVITSKCIVLLQSQTLSDNAYDNILEKFFVDLDKVYLQKYPPQHITVIGASADDLQQSKPLFESSACVICKETEKCANSDRLNQESFAVVFLENLKEETFEKKVKILSHCRKCKVLFLSNEVIQGYDVSLIFNMALQHNLLYSRFGHLGKNSIELYSDLVLTNCSMGARLFTIWKPGTSLDVIKTWLTESRKMHGCPISVSSITSPPKIMIDEDENGSLTIASGPEGKLVLELAQKLNFTIVLRYPSIEDQLKYSRKIAILNDVATKVSEIGIGQLRPLNDLNGMISISVPYDEECITWGVPRMMEWSNDIVWVEFSWQVWLIIAVLFCGGCIIRYVRRSGCTSNKPEAIEFTKIVLEAVAIHVGNPIIHVSSSPEGRIMLIIYLYYTLVLTTAYKTSLASILATDEYTPKIVDAQGIINSNLKVEGTLYDYDILKDQVNDSKITSELLKRFDISNNDSTPWEAQFRNQDTAFLGQRSSLNYERQMNLRTREKVTFDILKDCVLTHPTVMAFHTGSFLIEPADQIILLLLGAGIMEHWTVDEIDADKLLKRKSAEKYIETRAVDKFQSIFVFYTFFMGLCVLSFMLELLASRLCDRKRYNAR